MPSSDLWYGSLITIDPGTRFRVTAALVGKAWAVLTTPTIVGAERVYALKVVIAPDAYAMTYVWALAAAFQTNSTIRLTVVTALADLAQPGRAQYQPLLGDVLRNSISDGDIAYVVQNQAWPQLAPTGGA